MRSFELSDAKITRNMIGKPTVKNGARGIAPEAFLLLTVAETLAHLSRS